MRTLLAAFGDTIAGLVASASPMLAAIRIGSGRHLTGLVCGGDTIVTTARALLGGDSFSIALADRTVRLARRGQCDLGSNLAALHLRTPGPGFDSEVALPTVGGLAILLGADIDAFPTVRLTVVHRLMPTTDGPAAVLDLPGAGFEPGGPVLDTHGRLIGLAALGPNGEAMAIPAAAVARLLSANQVAAEPPAPAPQPCNARGWLGVTLQPITVPDLLRARTGQPSGRMVVSISKGGPAEKAGMRVGDVLLSLNATSVSGPQALRAFLAAERVGATVGVKLLRAGNVLTTQLTVAEQPE